MSDGRAESESADVEATFDPRHPLIFQRGYDPEADGAASAAAGPGGRDSSSRSWRARRPSAPVFPSHDPATRQARGQADEQADLQADLRFRRPETTDAAAGAGVLIPGMAAGRDARDPVSGESVPGESVPGESAQVQAWDPDQPAYPRRNPYIVALWIVGIGLIVGGIAFQWWAASLSNNSYSGNEVPVEVILQQFAWTCSPAMIAVGGLTLVILIFLRALSWQPRVSATDIPDAEPSA